MTIIPERACTILSRESDYKRPCFPVYKKTGWEAHPQSIEGSSYPRLIEGVQAVSRRKTIGRCEPQSQLPVNIILLYCYFILFHCCFIVCIIVFNNLITVCFFPFTVSFLTHEPCALRVI